MVVIHIASINNNPFNGVSVAVPQHVITQSKFDTIGFININNEAIDSIQEESNINSDKKLMQIDYQKPFDIEKFPMPFTKPDIVVFHECYRIDYLHIGEKLRKKGIPYVICPHGELRYEAQQKKHLKKVVANILLFNRFINNAAAIQCLSNAEVGATRFEKKKLLGTNGVYMPRISKNKFNNVEVRFVYIGRYEWRVKGLDLLFEAIRKKSDLLRSKKCVFDLYGPDILGRLEQVKELVRQNDIGDLVNLHTEISGSEKENILLGADIFIQTSRHEGMPMGILEALSYGIPCLISEGTTLGKVIEDNGAGWNAGSTSDDIANALERCLSVQDDWLTYGNGAVTYVKHNFDWDIISKKNLKTYKQLISFKGKEHE